MAGIYIHIPFCKQACHYCNFYFETNRNWHDAVVNGIIEEIFLTKKETFIDAKEPIHTIYFGGGTPSILPTSSIKKILVAIRHHYNVAFNAEITLEANPDDIHQERLEQWKAMGINRLSIGVQSFFEEDLQWMHRAHNAKQALKNVELARKHFDNMTIDLIYGLPNLSNERWQENVNIAISLEIPHLSCYALTVEEKTALYKLISLGKKQQVDQEKQSQQFLLLMQWLEEAKYEHYEISNFAKQGFRSRHNASYWTGEYYYGFGPAAHSYNGHTRKWNIADNKKYVSSMAMGIIPCEAEVLTPTQKLNEYLMIALRTKEGINLETIDVENKTLLLSKAAKYVAQDLLTMTTSKLVLTNAGKLFADGIAADLFF